jgi:hypothetical protein
VEVAGGGSSATSQNSREMRQSEEEKMRGGAASGADALHYVAETRGEENVGAGAALAVAAEREEFGSDDFGGGDEPDGWAPPVSRQREREGEPAGPRGFGPKWPKRGRGREIPFYFSNKFSIHFPNGFLINLTFVFKTLIT